MCVLCILNVSLVFHLSVIIRTCFIHTWVAEISPTPSCPGPTLDRSPRAFSWIQTCRLSSCAGQQVSSDTACLLSFVLEAAVMEENKVVCDGTETGTEGRVCGHRQ